MGYRAFYVAFMCTTFSLMLQLFNEKPLQNDGISGEAHQDAGAPAAAATTDVVPYV